MLYKFKSRATADLIMLEPIGRCVLSIIGKEATDHGIIVAAQIPAAIAALQAAVAEDEAVSADTDVDTQGDGPTEGKGDGVRLRQRVAPFIEMLARSAAEGHDVVW